MAGSELVHYDEQPTITFYEHHGAPAISFHEHPRDDVYSQAGSLLHLWASKHTPKFPLSYASFDWSLISHELALAANRQIFFGWSRRDIDARHYNIPLVEAFGLAAHEYPSISVDPEVMGGAPCVVGTRIPVYMILDAIEYQGSVEGALESYPRLTLDQIKSAVGFAKLVVECPIGQETTTTSR